MIDQKYFSVHEGSPANRGFTLLKMLVRKHLEKQKETEKDILNDNSGISF